MAPHSFSHKAMATRFELRIAHPDLRYAAQAAAACFAELERLESLLSRFEESSEIACLGRLQPGQRLRVSSDTFDCLRLAQKLHAATGGAFDPTLGHLLDALRTGDAPAPAVPARRLLLDEATLEVFVEGGLVGVDLGAIGKGFAIDRLGSILADWELPNALLVAGGSSILGLGEAEQGMPWTATLGEGETRRLVQLTGRGLGASGVSEQGEHILDPVLRVPARRAFRTWALAPTAAEADAYSTACMHLSLDQLRELCDAQPELGFALQLTPDPGQALLLLGQVPPFPHC